MNKTKPSKFLIVCSYIYMYFPRFMEGYCILVPKGKDAGFYILTPVHNRTLLAEDYLTYTKFFNLFGRVIRPTIVRAYAIKK